MMLVSIADANTTGSLPAFQCRQVSFPSRSKDFLWGVCLTEETL